MALTEEFEKEKLIIGIFFSDRDIYDKAIVMLTDRFGPIDLVSEEFSFSEEYSSYYDGELGGPAIRKIISFERLVDPSEQADIKLFTNELEFSFEKDRRRINLDPGVMSHGRLLLMTTKKTGFRIPLKDGIYSELTLFFARGDWQKLPWTYRDYQSRRVQSFLTVVRNKYLEQRKELYDLTLVTKKYK